MPSAANGDVDKQAPIPNGENSPIRRMVEILQAKIISLEKQRTKLASGGKGGKEPSASGEPKGNSVKIDELNQMLEFVWDLCKQAMGIAILSENEAKKQARKESVVRKTQDLQLVRDVLLILDCLEQLNDPAARQDFLAGTGGASQLCDSDLRLLDSIYPEVTPKHFPEEGEPSFEEQTTNAARHLIAIIDGSPGEIVGSTYAHVKSVVDTVHECGYLDSPKDAAKVVEETVELTNEVEPVVVEDIVEYVLPPQSSPPTQPAPPPPAPQAVPTPTFPILPPNAPPVTLQQVEHAYFAQQYGHPQKPPIPEVFSPLNFIFLQESEIDTPEPAQPPSPRSVTPNSIPSQTFTNQNFALPGQHFTPGPDPHMPPLPPGAPHYPQEIPPNHMAGFPAGNPPPPIPMPPMVMPPPSYPQNIPYKVAHPHSIDRVQPPSTSPSNPVDLPPQQDIRIPSPPQSQPITQDADYSEWNPQTTDNNKNNDQLEIDEWNSPNDHKNEHDTEGGNQSDGQSGNRFRSRGRGGGRSGPGNYRGRGGYQNGGRSNGNYYRNNENYQSRNSSNTNGDSYNRDNGNKFDNSQGGYQQGGYKGGRGNSEGRGGWARRDGGGNTGNGKGGAPRRGGPPRDGGSRGPYQQQRKGPGTQYGTENKGNENKQYSQ